jgi:hypothetical protein
MIRKFFDKQADTATGQYWFFRKRERGSEPLNEKFWKEGN